MNSSKEEQINKKSNASSSKSKEKINASKNSEEKMIESLDEQDKKEIKELLSNLDDEIVEGRLKLSDSMQSSRSSSVCSKKTATSKSRLTNTSVSQKSMQQKVLANHNKPSKNKKSIPPEEQEKRDVQEIFKNLEDEIEEGILKDPSRLKNNKSSTSTNEKVEMQSEQKSSSNKHVSINNSKVQKKGEDSEEQEKREVRELLNNLSDEVVEGIIKLPNGVNDKLESTSESEKLTKKSVKSKSKSKVTIESIKDRNITENYDDSEKRELKEFYDNLRDELEVGILRLSDGFHHHKSTTASESASEASIQKSESRVSSKTASKISHVSSKTGISSTEQDIRDFLDNLSEEPEVGILQPPTKF